jgi:hypothetical protein
MRQRTPMSRLNTVRRTVEFRAWKEAFYPGTGAQKPQHLGHSHSPTLCTACTTFFCDSTSTSTLECLGNPTCTRSGEPRCRKLPAHRTWPHGHCGTADCQAWRHGFSAQCTFAARLWNGVRVSRNRIPARVQSSLIGRALLHAEITTNFLKRTVDGASSRAGASMFQLTAVAVCSVCTIEHLMLWSPDSGLGGWKSRFRLIFEV